MPHGFWSNPKSHCPTVGAKKKYILWNPPQCYVWTSSGNSHIKPPLLFKPQKGHLIFKDLPLWYPRQKELIHSFFLEFPSPLQRGLFWNHVNTDICLSLHPYFKFIRIERIPEGVPDQTTFSHQPSMPLCSKKADEMLGLIHISWTFWLQVLLNFEVNNTIYSVWK